VFDPQDLINLIPSGRAFNLKRPRASAALSPRSPSFSYRRPFPLTPITLSLTPATSTHLPNRLAATGKSFNVLTSDGNGYIIKAQQCKFHHN